MEDVFTYVEGPEREILILYSLLRFIDPASFHTTNRRTTYNYLLFEGNSRDSRPRMYSGLVPIASSKLKNRNIDTQIVEDGSLLSQEGPVLLPPKITWWV